MDCTIEDGHLRLGLRYVRGLRAEAGYAIADERRKAPFTSMDDLVRRVPELHRDELRKLAKVGALNFINDVHRRDALWESELVTRRAGPLFEQLEAVESRSPLAAMTTKERLHADFSGTGVTVGRHPMAFYRPMLAAKKGPPRHRPGLDPERPDRAGGRGGDRAPAAGNRERLPLPQPGRRDRHLEHHRSPRHVRSRTGRC